MHADASLLRDRIAVLGSAIRLITGYPLAGHARATTDAYAYRRLRRGDPSDAGTITALIAFYAKLLGIACATPSYRPARRAPSPSARGPDPALPHRPGASAASPATRRHRLSPTTEPDP